jgi:hypothetical protein
MSDTGVEYRVEVSIKRCVGDDEDFVEIGFAGVTWGSIDGAAFAIETILQCREWETTAGMPDPSEVDR